MKVKKLIAVVSSLLLAGCAILFVILSPAAVTQRELPPLEKRAASKFYIGESYGDFRTAAESLGFTHIEDWEARDELVQNQIIGYRFDYAHALAFPAGPITFDARIEATFSKDQHLTSWKLYWRPHHLTGG